MPVAALADDAAATTPANYGTSQKIEKTYKYGNTPYVPTDFQFKLDYKNATQVGSNATAAPTLKNSQDSTVSITATDADNDGISNGEVTLSSLVDKWNFTAPGEYTFTVSEVNGRNPNVSYDTNIYEVRVDVVWADNTYKTVKVNGYAVYAVTNGTAATTKSEKATFTNGSNAASGNLVVSKTVAGTAANTNDYFKYTLQLTDPTQVSGTYSVVKDGQVITTLESDHSYTATFYLKSGEQVSVTGLPKNVSYKVTEGTNVVTAADGAYIDTTTDNGYTETVKNGSADSVESTEAEGTLPDNGVTVAYTNEKGFAPTTGITANTLPFAVGGIAVVVAGGALIISRRRRAGEDF
jgi:pilin isopeptide linkage protein/LPXTG-motif cell wall-anchored protein